MENIPWVAALLVIGDWLIRVALSLRVIMRRRAVGTSLAWLAIILLLPFAGGFLYVLIGETHLGRTRAARAEHFVRRFRILREAILPQVELDGGRMRPGDAALARLAQSLAGFGPTSGNRWELMESATEFFDRLRADIESAAHSVCLQFYIWHLGGDADEIVAAVERAARRGVRTAIQVDALGSAAFVKSDAFKRLKAAGAHAHAALPVGFFRLWFRRLDLRNHRKIAVIDERIGYTGSQNLVDPRFFKQEAHVGQWVDAMARIEGPAVDALWLTFASDWELDTGQEFARQRPPVAIDRGCETGVMQVVPSGPQFAPEVINQILLTAIYSARRELIITSPYFVPDESLMTALTSAARRGVDVTVILPARNDSRLVRLASEAMSGDLLAAGVRIVGFEGGLLHTKSITADGSMSMFGSLNLDPRSLWLNFEISLLVYDDEFTHSLRDLQREYIRQSTEMTFEDWQKCSIMRRLLRNAVRLLAPLL